ncbi:MAG: hypothetical protein HFE64_00545 [Lachnospiraceae bacterium]|jgi:hypothetical protein|nr:hypothetical protein [Lachnospiraceae bacterium]
MVEEIPPEVAEEIKIAEKIQLYFQFQPYSAQHTAAAFNFSHHRRKQVLLA